MLEFQSEFLKGSKLRFTAAENEGGRSKPVARTMYWLSSIAKTIIFLLMVLHQQRRLIGETLIGNFFDDPFIK